jgi:hypothetical protein
MANKVFEKVPFLMCPSELSGHSCKWSDVKTGRGDGGRVGSSAGTIPLEGVLVSAQAEPPGPR